MVFYRNPFQDWQLVKHTNDMLQTPRGRYYAQAMLANMIPPYGAYLRTMDAMEEMDNSLKLYGLDYDDIHYVTKTRGFDGSFPMSTYNFISSNINRLYK